MDSNHRPPSAAAKAYGVLQQAAKALNRNSLRSGPEAAPFSTPPLTVGKRSIDIDSTCCAASVA
jgi:hypothetical protein